MPRILFNKSFIAGKELYYIAEAVLNGQIKGDGPFTKKCESWMEKKFGAQKVLLTTSCSAALDMAAILCDVKPGDEVILPSYTFPSTANAFVLRGANPIFVDICCDTLNIDAKKIQEVITQKTRAICVVHYSGVGCDMDAIMAIAHKYNLFLVEDAAQGVMAHYKSKFLGTIGDIGAYSFHETKNYSAGEGGAIVINNPKMLERAEIIREKGTNRSKFFRGEVNKYTWVDIGSSYLPSEVLAAYLYAQLEKAEEINEKRLMIWQRYWEGLKPLQEKELLRMPIASPGCEHNAHMFYIILRSKNERDGLMNHLRDYQIGAVFHYIPLHISPMGMKFGYKKGDLPISEEISSRLLRLPFYNELSIKEQNYVINKIFDYFNNIK